MALLIPYLLWEKIRDYRERKRIEKLLTCDTGVALSETICHDTPLPLFDFHMILLATNNFANENKLGEGGFGPVYKGKLYRAQIAVKRLSKVSGQGLQEFKNELRLISKFQHRNLVRLLGCCIYKEEKLLLYEFMPNKSLDQFLFDIAKKGLLGWETRYSIIQGIARGLLYLHRDSTLRVIHRDLKVSNILLDEEMIPKISDFGLARIFGRDDDNETNTRRVAGTIGYMSPEYAMKGVFSVKSDVYSFGVILLEIVSGKKNRTYDPESSLGLLPYAWKLWNEDNVMEFVDPSIRDSCSPAEVSRCIIAGLLCVQYKAIDRPTMSSVVAILEGGSTDFELPRQPIFNAERTPSETDILPLDLEFSATASFTALIGR